MEIRVSHEQTPIPVTVFQIKGDLRAEEELTAKAIESFEAGTRNLLLDLSGVRYISSSGLRALHSIFTLLRADTPEESDEAVHSGITAGTYTSPHFKLLKPNKDVLKVLKTAGYDLFLDIHTDYKKAIQSF